jgi:oxidase EvaA
MTPTHHIEFLRSALDKKGKVISADSVKNWIKQRRQAIKVQVEAISFDEMDHWMFDHNTGNLVHSSGKFFSIEGVEISTNYGKVFSWTQPIINQPEVGILGFLTKKIDGVLHFLVQAKIEPGNINAVQLSPTLQATKSNYTKVHKGRTPLYLEYFNGEKKVKVLLDQLQSEQGARFLKKRNRNVIIEVEEEIEVYEDFCWLTLGQIKELLKNDNLVNMDTRTVISGISYGTYLNESNTLLSNFVYSSDHSLQIQNELLLSALDSQNNYYYTEQIISWITGLKCRYELDVKRIPLRSVKDWIIDKDEIYHKDRKYFSVVATTVSISNREVSKWSQPLIKSAQEGIIAFIIKRINGVFHFLVQAKVEAGNFDILELAPTVQCLTGNYRTGHNEYEVAFLEFVINAPKEQIVHRSLQSEEGGRFFEEQNLNIIVEVGDDFSIQVPENYAWMTLSQLYSFIQYNNYLNIQARSLLSTILF